MKSEQIRTIQEQLDKAKDSEMYVRAQRATCPWYPYESEEQQRLTASTARTAAVTWRLSTTRALVT